MNSMTQNRLPTQTRAHTHTLRSLIVHRLRILHKIVRRCFHVEALCSCIGAFLLLAGPCTPVILDSDFIVFWTCLAGLDLLVAISWLLPHVSKSSPDP